MIELADYRISLYKHFVRAFYDVSIEPYDQDSMRAFRNSRTFDKLPISIRTSGIRIDDVDLSRIYSEHPLARDFSWVHEKLEHAGGVPSFLAY